MRVLTTSSPAATWITGAAAVMLLAVAAAVLPALAAPLSYDPEAWLVWGRELTSGSLDVTQGPAIKPLPMLVAAGSTSLLGADGARLVWAIASTAGLLASAALAMVVLLRANVPALVAAAAGLVVLGVPTIAAGGLTGAAEPMTLAALLAGVVLLAGRRPAAASAALVVATLMRPEAMVALLAALGAAILASSPGARRWRQAAAAAGIAVVVPGLWVALQLAGSSTLSGGVDAATALRPGQPGLAAQPIVAATQDLLAALLPGLGLAAGARALTQPPSTPSSASAYPDQRAIVVWLVITGGSWVATVLVLSELGFSGEPRYLAPGAVLVALAVVGVAAGNRSVRTGRWSRAALLAVVAVVGVLASVRLADAWRDARALAASQAELTVLLAEPGVRNVARSCSVVAVPRFLRPAVAWRLQRPISSLQSPSLTGADCVVSRASTAPSSDALRRLAEHGQWVWWARPRANADR